MTEQLPVGIAVTSEKQDTFKVLVIGDSAVGKSSLLMRYTEGTFSQEFIATIGIDFKTKTLQVNGKQIKMQVWDTAGQERFRTITTAYYRTAHGILLVYDVSNPASFESLSHWAEQIELHASDSVIRYIVGNKCDLKQAVPKDRVADLANTLGVKAFQTSAKTAVGIDEMFLSLAKDIQKNINKIERVDGVELSDTRKPSEGCCK